MKKTLALLVAAAALSFAADAQKSTTPTAPPPTTASSGGVSVTTNPTPPPGAKKAEIQDLRVLDKESEDPYEYERYGLGAYRSNNFQHARGFFEKSWKYGELPSAAYNLACVDLKEGKKDAAFAQLEKAVAVGYDDEKDLLNDPDLAPIRGEARFAKIVESARRNRAQGDASVVKEGIFVAPEGRPVGILLVLHPGSSDPLTATSPFLDGARGRGLYVAAPRGPAKAGRKRFGWGGEERAFAAVGAALDEARKRAGNPQLPVLLVGVGRGGTLAFTIAAKRAGVFNGVGSVGGAFEPGGGDAQRAAADVAALRGPRLFFGVPADAPQAVVASIGRGVEALKRQGLTPVLRSWPGPGDTFPTRDVAGAVKETLDYLMGTKR